MALWSYFGDRRSFRGNGNQNVGRRLVNGIAHRGRTISETLDVLEDVEEEMPHSPENTSDDTGPSASPTPSVNEASLASSYQSDQGSLKSSSGAALLRRWLGRTRSVDESASSSSPDRGELLLTEPVGVHYVQQHHHHPVATDIFPSRHRVRHSSAPFPSKPDPPRRDPRFIDKSLIDVKRIHNGSSVYKNGHADEPDVWIPRSSSVRRKVYIYPSISFYPTIVDSSIDKCLRVNSLLMGPGRCQFS